MNPMSEMQQQIERDHNDMRRMVLTMRVLDGLLQTIQVQAVSPETNVDDVRAHFTDASARYIAPLIEAVHILEAIIFASDGCTGHRHCMHSMEPWQRARELLKGKWEADTGERRHWPDLDERT